MNEAAERPPEKVCGVDECNAWKEGEYPYCHHHKGLAETDGAPEANQNAQRHGLYSVPEYLKEHFSERQEDRYIAYFEALCSRYERVHFEEPDAFAKDRLSRVAIECVKERIADQYLAENAESTLLTQKQIEDVGGQPIEVEKENHILKELTALKRETRLTLKDMGLLRSPEDKQADATKELSEVVSRALEPQDG